MAVNKLVCVPPNLASCVIFGSTNMTVINTNTGSLYAQQALTTNARGLSTVMQQLSTGKRINNAVDDVAGLAISTRLTSQIRGLNQAVRNTNDGISLIQTAEGATEQVTNMLQRMRELAVQASNDTNNTNDRSYLDLEFQALSTQIGVIANNTQWNGTNVMDGTSRGSGSGVFSFQVGANSGQTIMVTLSNMTTTSGTGKLSAITSNAITSTAAAGSALGSIITALDTVALERSGMGAAISRLQFTADNLATVSAKAQESRSRIEDTDYSQATTELARRNIIQQAAQAMLAQANQAPQMVLQLLK
jgi:flagellin